MKPTVSLILSLAALMGINLVQTASPPWGYSGTNGPANWRINYPVCGGSYQSPINIEGGYEDSWPIPSYNYYSDIPSTMTLTNTGHILKLSGTSPAGRVPYLNILTESGTTRRYQLDSVHFHWGKYNTEGSEHTFAGRRFAMEMQAVHLRVKDGAVMVPNQIVTLAYVFKISSSDNPALNKFLTRIANVRNPDSTTSVPPFAWSELIPEFRSNFYLYKGSLTIPPCAETVNWFIRKSPAVVSSSQMAKFRTLLDWENHGMTANWRPTQDDNDRTVYYIY